MNKKHKIDEKQHNVNLAMILSFIPGIGQYYNQRLIKGTIFFGLFVSFIFTFTRFLDYGYWGLVTLGTLTGIDDSRTLLIQGILAIFLTVVALGFYIVNIFDARRDANKIKNGETIPSIRKAIYDWFDNAFPYLLITPAFLLLSFVVLLPLIFMIFLAFTNYTRYNAPPGNLLEWIGFQNFIDIFNVPIWRDTFFSVLSWTVTWTFGATTLQIALALFLALIVNDSRVKFKRTIRTIFILPWAVPAFVSILIFAALFDDNFGAINRDIVIPLLGTGLPWMTDPFWTKTAIIMIQTWLGFPFVFALFTGVLQSIPNDWYEAADVDGGTAFQKFRKITLPHILFVTSPLLIMQYAANFNNFNIIYLFNEGGPGVRGQNAGGTDILISWVYKLTFENNMYSIAAVISVILGLTIATFAFFQFRRSRTFKEEGEI